MKKKGGGGGGPPLICRTGTGNGDEEALGVFLKVPVLVAFLSRPVTGFPWICNLRFALLRSAIPTGVTGLAAHARKPSTGDNRLIFVS